MALLREVGWTAHRVADELGVHTRTARRWAAGTNQPNPANLIALRGVVGQLAMRQYTLSGQPTDEALLLERAADALTTSAEREGNARLAEDIRAHLDAGNAAREADMPAPRIAHADVFALVGATDYPKF
jgi:transcriptional regulator with XRE-family HTH domain